MQLSFRPYSLEFKHPFGVHGNTRSSTNSVMIRIEANGLLGYGEACLPAYLGESLEATLTFLKACVPLLHTCSFEQEIMEILNLIEPLVGKNNAGKAAIDIALQDLYAKNQGKSYGEWMKLDNSLLRATSITIGIDQKEIIEQKIKEASEFKILKVKLGTQNDKEIIQFIRQHTQKPLYVDVNQGWTNKQEALRMLEWLNDQNVLLAEQPMPVTMKEEMKWLTKHSPIPTFADESVKRLYDLKELEASFSGVNIKLMKSGGMTEALEMIDYAKIQGIQIMLGCMAESSCATTAMAQLMQFADHIDLDAPNLYKNDPFTGLEYKNGMIQLNNLPGLGIEPKVNLFDSI